jgi:hypothetical protein
MVVRIDDDPKDLVVKYLFVNKWTWTDVLHKEVFQGHPFEGKIYRALYHTKKKSYRVLIDTENALYLETLTTTEPEKGFLCEVDEITKQNLDKLLNWTTTENKDLMPNEQNIKDFLQLITEGSQESTLMDDALHVADELLNLHTDWFQVWLEIGGILTEQSVLDHDSPVAILAESEEGMSLNIGEALKDLKTYIGDNRKTNFDRTSIHQAIIALVRELHRRDLNELD